MTLIVGDSPSQWANSASASIRQCIAEVCGVGRASVFLSRGPSSRLQPRKPHGTQSGILRGTWGILPMLHLACLRLRINQIKIN
jgi:hypothetical protein